MIRIIRTKNLRALREGAELASVLQADLEDAENNNDLLTADLQDAEKRNDLQAADLEDAKSRNKLLADEIEALTALVADLRSQRDTAMKDTETAAAALTAESLAYAFHKAAVAEAATEIAMALSADDTRASVRKVSAVLLRRAKTLGIDTDSNEKKGAAA
ncbi:hypothetical protein GCM10010363_60160 [Streptomyces omiyaensis]|uniref:hypothetical protein n=1 Tax=Streptomyces omiyaensis TaxID=68247 RepID=UPI001679EC72|nr:hypothetical protein [Streptomyces omiyaensis]GGY71011.1 hypothetical protein GCM10010363_60160 [Streptomyces omiyaensis]